MDFGDFAPVALLDTRPYILVVHPSVPATSVRELIALAKARPGKLTYASGGGVGSGNHLAGEMFKSSAGVDILHVPYKGGGPALNDLLGGVKKLRYQVMRNFGMLCEHDHPVRVVEAEVSRGLAAPG